MEASKAGYKGKAMGPAAAPRRLTTMDAKVLNFAYSASGVSWNRFCNMWLLQCGFSPREVGLMKSLSLLGKLVAQPVWAGTADAGSPPFVLTVSVVVSMLTLEGLRLGTRDGSGWWWRKKEREERRKEEVRR